MFTMADLANNWFLLTQCHTTEKALYRDIRNEAKEEAAKKEKAAEYIDKIVNTEPETETTSDTTSSSATTTSKVDDAKNMKDFAEKATKIAEKIMKAMETGTPVNAKDVSSFAKSAAKVAGKEKNSTNKVVDFPKLEDKPPIDLVVNENGKAVPVNEEQDENASTIDIDIVYPKLINDDQYKDILRKEEIKYSALPWFISQGVTSGILYSAGKIGLNQMLAQIEESTMNHPETAVQFQMDGLKTNMQDVINAITSTFSDGKPAFAGLPRIRIEEVCSKDYLNNIVTDVFELTDHDKSVKRIFKRIRKYQYKKAETNPEKPIDPVVRNRNTVCNETNALTFKKIDEAFGTLLNGKHHTYCQYGNYIGMYIDGVIDPNGQPHPFLIDPNMIIGNGYCLLATASTTGTCLINIAEHRDIVKKIIENYNYILNDEEYRNIKKGQFINEELYAILDMSGMSDNMSMSDNDMKSLEDRLNKIFGIKNPVFIGLQFIPRFRFSLFKSINDFTLVSDSKVKTQCEQLLQNRYPIMPDNDTVAITVSEHNYVLTYRGNNVTMSF